ncbi:hypothetical protein TARUN_8127 [Trichoderma arundinaceum]|uniref:Uncharacterized protein n=1 Tax=Trichoderma arundinaceum TaxID=490622 RepID=A0A395NE65_TRIAR|nr:hypothetical protein TARUN_8127 [Trichoderma arundinaceum]
MRSSGYAQGAVAFFSLFTLGFAAECASHSGSIPSFSVSDGRSLQNDIHGNVFDSKLDFPLFLEAGHVATFSVGSATACLENSSPFENTHIGQTDLANAIQNILDECEKGDGTSRGGKVKVTGDTQAAVELVLRDRALGC